MQKQMVIKVAGAGCYEHSAVPVFSSSVSDLVQNINLRW